MVQQVGSTSQTAWQIATSLQEGAGETSKQLFEPEPQLSQIFSASATQNLSHATLQQIDSTLQTAVQQSTSSQPGA